MPSLYRPLHGYLLSAFVALAACSSSPEAVSPATADGGVDSGPVVSADAAPTRSESCLEQDAWLAELVGTTRKSPVAVLAVANEACGVSVYVGAAGEAPPPEALYRVGSVTKTYVAAAILLVEKEGKLSLDDRVSKHVPGFPALEKVTVRQLLDHTSGLANFTADPDFPSLAKKKRTPREIVEKALTMPPSFEPGQGFAYSNTNYTLLGMVLEAATGEKVSAVIRSRVLVPAKLERTFLDGEEALPEALVKGFGITGRNVTNAEDPSNPWTAGAIAASAGDVARWHQALFGGTFLPPDVHTKLTAAPAKVDSRTGYGLGVFVTEGGRDGFGKMLAHGGDIEGFHTASVHYVDRRTTITSIVNQDGVDPGPVVSAAARLLFGR